MGRCCLALGCLFQLCTAHLRPEAVSGGRQEPFRSPQKDVHHNRNIHQTISRKVIEFVSHPKPGAELGLLLVT